MAEVAAVFVFMATSFFAAVYAARADDALLALLALLLARPLLFFRPPLARGEAAACATVVVGVAGEVGPLLPAPPFASASRVWIRSCFFKLPHCAKALPHVLH